MRGVFVLAFLANLLGSCKQDEGGRCEIDSDCVDDLVCLKETGFNGICTAPGGSGGVPDAAVDAPAANDAGDGDAGDGKPATD